MFLLYLNKINAFLVHIKKETDRDRQTDRQIMKGTVTETATLKKNIYLKRPPSALYPI